MEFWQTRVTSKQVSGFEDTLLILLLLQAKSNPQVNKDIVSLIEKCGLNASQSHDGNHVSSLLNIASAIMNYEDRAHLPQCRNLWEKGYATLLDSHKDYQEKCIVMLDALANEIKRLEAMHYHLSTYAATIATLFNRMLADPDMSATKKDEIIRSHKIELENNRYKTTRFHTECYFDKDKLTSINPQKRFNFLFAVALQSSYTKACQHHVKFKTTAIDFDPQQYFSAINTSFAVVFRLVDEKLAAYATLKNAINQTSLAQTVKNNFFGHIDAAIALWRLPDVSLSLTDDVAQQLRDADVEQDEIVAISHAHRI